jgi:hypothetical protein
VGVEVMIVGDQLLRERSGEGLSCIEAIIVNYSVRFGVLQGLPPLRIQATYICWLLHLGR